MVKYRNAPVDKNILKRIDNYGNVINNSGYYYMFTCPSCRNQNAPYAISSGKCNRCDYKLSYRDETIK